MCYTINWCCCIIICHTLVLVSSGSPLTKKSCPYSANNFYCVSKVGGGVLPTYVIVVVQRKNDSETDIWLTTIQQFLSPRRRWRWRKWEHWWRDSEIKHLKVHRSHRRRHFIFWYDHLPAKYHESIFHVGTSMIPKCASTHSSSQSCRGLPLNSHPRTRMDTTFY